MQQFELSIKLETMTLISSIVKHTKCSLNHTLILVPEGKFVSFQPWNIKLMTLSESLTLASMITLSSWLTTASYLSIYL